MAFVDVRLAIASFVPSQTEAGVVADAIDARGAVQTRRRLAFVHFFGAIVSAEARARAGAFKAVDQVRAGAVIPARIGFAFVDVDASSGCCSGESSEADALMRIHPRVETT